MIATTFVTLENRHLELKWKAILAYESQFKLQRPYCKWEVVESMARVRGLQNYTPYAEAFETIRLTL